MDKINDYIYFLKENNDIFSELEEHVTLAYDLFHPTILVLNYFVEKKMKVQDLSKSEAEDIFSIGYYYLFNSIQTIKEILNENFNHDIEEMISFDEHIYLILKIENILESVESETLSQIEDQLRRLIEFRKQITEEAVESVENEIEKVLNIEEVQTTSDYFVDIAEALDIEVI